MNWFIIVLVIAGILLVMKVLHLRHLKHRFMGVFIVILLVLLIGSIYLVTQQNKIDMTTVDGFSKGMQVYAGFLLNGFQNVKTITGYAIGMDWSSGNKSISMNNDFANGTSKIGARVVNTTVNTVREVKANTPNPITTYK